MSEDQPVKPKAEQIVAKDDLTRFLAVVGHELRTPLGAFVTTVDLLAETELTEKQSQYLVTLREAAQAGLVLTDLLLSTRDNDDGVCQETFAPGEVMRSVEALLAPVARAKGMRLICQVSPGADEAVVGSAVALRQAVTALVDNALKYAASGDIEIVANVGAGDDFGDLIVTVGDGGPGIDAAERDRIFAMFERGGASAGVTSGYGLGLWITQQILRHAGGSLALDAEAASGARFVIRLPVRPAASIAETAIEAAAFPATESDALAGVRVLAIDDSMISRRLIAACLDGFGVRCDVAASGAEGLAMLERDAYAAVILDLHMPGMNGGDVARRILQRRTEPMPSLIGLSADPGALEGESGVRGVFRGVVAKPFKPADLFQALVHAIDR